MTDNKRFEVLDFVTAASNNLFKIDDWIIKLEDLLQYHELLYDLEAEIYSLMEQQREQQLYDYVTHKAYDLLQQMIDKIVLNRKIKKELRKHFKSSKTSYELFIQEFIDLFIDGFVCSNAYNTYQKWCEKRGFVACSVKTFGSNVKMYCDRIRSKMESRPWVYMLKEDAKQYFDMNEEEEDDDLFMVI